MNTRMKTIAFGTLFAASTLSYGEAQFLDIPSADIPDAVKLSNSLDAVMEDASACRQDGLELANCLCGKPSIGRMSRTYETVIEKHPSWAGKTLRFEAENKSHAIQLPTFRRELERLGEACG
ncbi:hypothetical protein RE428_42730 [Marinobacter nanhaiticus D15-8W]|uniref:Uncharacterized protein n=1 Tax=Marinobacter nanhaiticus D15-8W TaxID=626887 RepID=N6WXS9_9GAMM|nr:hypothetical protein [Marinobacter nanhaiticus]ENO15887.1 hypothetical protein J057_11061 [Marinobacter nanhaiticus D15-8W]BES73255.1 hypothetical protein RE428_42730 [Marinobacter nanhaiticus D15-8W]